MYIVNNKATYMVGKCKVKTNKKKRSRLSKTKKLSLVLGILLLLSGTVMLTVYANNKPDGSIGTFTNSDLKRYEWSKDKEKNVPYTDSSSQIPKVMENILDNGKKVRM